jgi:LPS-assembly protein
MKVRIYLFITLLALCHPLVWSQELSRQLPGATKPSGTAVDNAVDASAAQSSQAPPAVPAIVPLGEIPIAIPQPPPPGIPVHIEAVEQIKRGDTWVLNGAVLLHYRDYTLHADHVEYNRVSGEVSAEGHLELMTADGLEDIHARNATLNLELQTGRFYEVTGTIGALHQEAKPGTKKTEETAHHDVYQSGNPMQLSARALVKYGPQNYLLLDAEMTFCQLPRPDWKLAAPRIRVVNGRASASNTLFLATPWQVPLFWMPFLTHPVNDSGRDSGFLLPTLGESSVKGYIFGEQIYWVINRSMDMTIGSQYYSKRGWAPSGQFRYTGRGEDFVHVKLNSLLDRGVGTPSVNQGGQDIFINARHDFDTDTRAIVEAEYLSSYLYRQAFDPVPSTATNSSVDSRAFATRNRDGFSGSLYVERYQNFLSTATDDQIRIWHAPQLELSALDHPFGPLVWNLKFTAANLSRSEPGYSTGGDLSRLDVHPSIALPLHYEGWSLRPEAAVRETYYSKSQMPPMTPGGAPSGNDGSITRSDVEASIRFLPPAVERDYTASWLTHLLHAELRHVMAPEVDYHYVTGINNFSSVPRVDETDLVSDANDLTYWLTQRFYLRRLHPRACSDIEAAAAKTNRCSSTAQWISWSLGQRYFFNPSFGGALVPGTANQLESTLNLTGIAFLGGERDSSPILSRLRIRTSEHLDVEWDLDYDTKAGRMDASNEYLVWHSDNYFAELSTARLNQLNPVIGPDFNASSAVTDYRQIKLLAGFGNPTHKGFSAAGNTSYDVVGGKLQYGGIEAAYNWNCCGFIFEYRQMNLGTIQNDNQYLFNLTLAGVGSLGTLSHFQRIF